MRSGQHASTASSPILLPTTGREETFRAIGPSAVARVGRTAMAVMGAVLASAGLAFAQAPGGPGIRDPERPIVIGASEVFFPYSYREDDGQLRGFAVDISDAVAGVAGLRLERVTVSNPALGDALRHGQVDIVQFWSETPARREWAAFSVPVVTFETVVVVRRGDTRFRTLDDLAGKTVGIGQSGTVGARYLREQQPEAIPAEDLTTEDFLRKVSDGTYDAAVLSRLTAVSMIERFRLKNLQVLGARIPGNEYDVRYCFVVRKADAALLSRLNEGLAIINRNGRFEEIFQKWFGRYEGRRYTQAEVLSYVAAALLLASIAATWGLVRQRSLLCRIRGQAGELAEQRSLLAALHEKHPLATVIFALPEAGPPRLVSINPEAARLLDLDPHAAPGTPLDALPLAADIAAHLQDALARGGARDSHETWEHRLPATRRLLETTLVPLGPADAAGPRVCVLLSDITHRRLADTELAQSRRLRALGELVGGIAHEFNNLLTPIIGTTNILRTERRDDHALQTDLGVVDEAARRAAELTRRLLTFGRKADDSQTVVSVAETVKNCFAMLQPTFDRRVQWHTDIPASLPPLAINPVDFNQALFNLVINARDTLMARLGRTHDGSWVPRLRVTATALPAPAHHPRRPAPDRVIDGWIRITVEDNGEGIAPEALDRIFEPFFTTKEVGKGTGLGLATVWHAVTEAGGDVLVDSRPGDGTRFHVLLPHGPAAVADAATELSASAPAAAAPRPRPHSESGRVLLAEDEAMVARTTLALLKRLGLAAAHVPDGMAAWERLERNSREFDILLLDVNMPRLSGVDLVRRVRSLGYAGRVVMMSGRVAEDDIAALRALGVDYILPKPFLYDDLQAALTPATVAGAAVVAAAR